MPRIKTVIQKRILKEALKQGKSYQQAMLEAGYAKSTSCRGIDVEGVQEVVGQINKEFNRNSITVDYVLKAITDLMENPNTKASDKVACLALLGKYLKLFTDQPAPQTTNVFQLYANELPTRQVINVQSEQLPNEQPVDNSISIDAPISKEDNTKLT
jgi:hypothetical protein